MSVNKLTPTKGSYLGLHSAQARLGAGDSIATGVTNTYDLDVSDFDNLTVLASLAATALADLVLTVFALDTGGNPHQIPIAPSVTPSAQVLVSNNALAAVQYDTRGLQTIRINVKNANAATKVLNFLDVFAGVTGVDY